MQSTLDGHEPQAETIEEVIVSLIAEHEGDDPTIYRIRDALVAEGLGEKQAHMTAATFVMMFELWGSFQGFLSSPMGRGLSKKIGRRR